MASAKVKLYQERAQQGVLIVSSHSSLPQVANHGLSKGECVWSFTQPGLPLCQSEVDEIFDMLLSGHIPEKADCDGRGEEIYLRVNEDVTPNYPIQFGPLLGKWHDGVYLFRNGELTVVEQYTALSGRRDWGDLKLAFAKAKEYGATDVLVLGCKTERKIVRIVKHCDLDKGRHLSAHGNYSYRDGGSSWALVCGTVSDQGNDLWELQESDGFCRIMKAEGLDKGRYLTAHGRYSYRDGGSSWALVHDHADPARGNDLWLLEEVRGKGSNVFRIRKAKDLDAGRCLSAHGSYSYRNGESSWALVHDHADPARGNDLWKFEYVG